MHDHGVYIWGDGRKYQKYVAITAKFKQYLKIFEIL